MFIDDKSSLSYIDGILHLWISWNQIYELGFKGASRHQLFQLSNMALICEHLLFLHKKNIRTKKSRQDIWRNMYAKFWRAYLA